MQMRIKLLALGGMLTALVGCSLLSPPAKDCNDGAVRFDKSFESGRFAQCRQLAPDHFELTLVPENTPINHSPWYAFTVASTTPQSIKVTLNYSHHKHRYWPKTSEDRRQWQRLSKDRFDISSDSKQATLTLDVDTSPLWVSAQPILDNRDYQQWLDRQVAAAPWLILSELGRSVEGRPLMMLQSQSGDDAPLMVFLGRQHPPEVTGALAMLTFVERLLADDPLAVAFRKQFNLLIVPNMNPDGVAAGNWRHNSHGVDLNRDWGPFAQPETRQVNAVIERLTQTAPLWNMLDFHSTSKDIFYTQTDHAHSHFPHFTREWLAAIDDHTTDFVVLRKDGHNPDLPTSKTYFYELHKVPAITYEMGDETSPGKIDEVAHAAAEQYMKQWLARRGQL